MIESRNETRRLAVVLSTFDGFHQRVVLLDKTLGKVVCFIPDKRLSVGTLIEYQLVQKRRYCTAHMINIIRMPFALAQTDILFLHHVLELCNHFLQEGMPAQNVFELVLFLYEKSDFLIGSFSKKLYISKLFVLFGIYPEKPYIETVYWQQVLACSIQDLLERCLKMPIEQELTIWIRSCVHMHPLSHTFKTLSYIEQKE